MYYSVKDMYALFRAGRINAQVGAERKRRAIRQYEIDTNRTETNSELVRNHAELWKRIEAAGAEYAKQRTITAADALYEAVYGVAVSRKHDRQNGKADYNRIEQVTQNGGEQNGERL